MLIRIVATNFRSYGQETEFTMLPSSSVRRKDWHVYNQGRGADVLRSAVIYGANGAGKSCLVKTLGRLQTMVEMGSLPPTAYRDANKYNSSQMPVSIEVEFGTGNDQYSYGVSYNGNRCIEEWLYSTIKKPLCVFERKYDTKTSKTKIHLTAEKKDTEKTKLLISLLEDNLLKDNELLLSKHEVVKNAQMTDAFSWLTTKLHVLFPETRSTSIFDNRYSDEDFKTQSEKIISALNLGIDELTLKDEDIESFKQSISEWSDLVHGMDGIVKRLAHSPGGEEEVMIDTGAFTVSMRREGNKYFVRRVKALHKVNDTLYDFELKEESDGTQRIFDFIPMVQNVKSEECTYVIDELDRSLHPTLVRALVSRIINDKSMKGQLIFTTHDAGLLDGRVFRNDEIWFAEKDRETQSTHLYTLEEFKPRADLNLEKGYLNGRFGAIPFLARFNELSWE